MSTQFPNNLDNFTNPTPSDDLNTPTVLHSTQHANLNDAVEALEAKVGVNNSVVTTSLDYITSFLSSAVAALTSAFNSLVSSLGSAAFQPTSAFDASGAAAAAQAASQPVNANLTAIAALATTSFGRGGLTQADAGTYRTYIGAGTSSFDGAFSSLSGKPATLAGYGITDAYTKTEDDTLLALKAPLVSPTLVTPTLGVASATTINKVTITAPATGSTLTIANGKTLTASNTITLTATDGSTLAIGAGGTLGSAAYTATTAYDAAGAAAAAQAASQPLDGTLTALAGLTIVANSLTIGTGADTFSQVTFGTNTFPARASTGNIVAKTITDFSFTFLDDADAATVRTTIGAGTGNGTVTTVSIATANGISGIVATATTTPVVTLALGVITPTSVNGITFSGTSTPALAVAGTASISGANTGDQTVPAAASQSDQETGTSVTTYVSPGRQQFHPSAAKAWVSYTTVTTTSAYTAYNCTLFDNGTGDTTITFLTAFSTANYTWSTGVGGGASGNNYSTVAPYLVTPTASAFRVATGVLAVSLNDSLYVSMHFFGDQ